MTGAVMAAATAVAMTTTIGGTITAGMAAGVVGIIRRRRRFITRRRAITRRRRLITRRPRRCIMRRRRFITRRRRSSRLGSGRNGFGQKPAGLAAPEGCVGALAGQQGAMGAFLDNAAGINDRQPVHAGDG